MKIKELIEELDKYDNDDRVVFRDAEGFYQVSATIGANELTCGNPDCSDRDKAFDDCVVISLY